ncbi:DUF742 domain-containing protein [Solwaraspora sp. WMMD406]|uniref:DUF742 domain-containing protein n=1 Tax=Solwaraspora sp. WMMD406 TaxID=3016095 RepID=UPI002415BC8E|nr:DUF742 domain-containing protein [Solwaraspora sp. WMMD406]MDG4767536.1 DUF742 domain-containing protein [Solwaraspora sp. WMMD406]
MTPPYGADEPIDAPPRVRPYLRTPPSEDDRRGPGGQAAGGDWPADDEAPGLRPFVLTAGRVTGADPDIGLETQVTARAPDNVPPGLAVRDLSPESQAIVALAAEPISVVEISARLGLHLGVTRVLVGDLRAAAHLDVHVPDVEASADADTILRVIRGLRAIS